MELAPVFNVACLEGHAPLKRAVMHPKCITLLLHTVHVAPTGPIYATRKFSHASQSSAFGWHAGKTFRTKIFWLQDLSMHFRFSVQQPCLEKKPATAHWNCVCLPMSVEAPSRPARPDYCGLLFKTSCSVLWQFVISQPGMHTTGFSVIEPLCVKSGT